MIVSMTNLHDGNDIQELHAYVRGRVQGVGFRYFVVEHALMLGLRGSTGPGTSSCPGAPALPAEAGAARSLRERGTKSMGEAKRTSQWLSCSLVKRRGRL